MLPIILSYVSIVIIAIYLCGYTISCGIPTSISATYYKTEKKWLFPVVIGLSALLACFPLVESTPDTFKFLAFIIVMDVLVVTASSAFKDDFVGKVHTVASIVLGIAALAWIILTSGVPYIAIGGVLAGILNRKNFIFWVEVGILLDLYFNLIIVLNFNYLYGA